MLKGLFMKKQIHQMWMFIRSNSWKQTLWNIKCSRFQNNRGQRSETKEIQLEAVKWLSAEQSFKNALLSDLLHRDELSQYKVKSYSGGLSAGATPEKVSVGAVKLVMTRQINAAQFDLMWP